MPKQLNRLRRHHDPVNNKARTLPIISQPSPEEGLSAWSPIPLNSLLVEAVSQRHQEAQSYRLFTL
jgi:hypothetical protein